MHARKRLVVAADADRRWIERDLHEIVRQQLVALAVNLQRTGCMPDAGLLRRRSCSKMMRAMQALDETAQLAQRIYRRCSTRVASRGTAVRRGGRGHPCLRRRSAGAARLSRGNGFTSAVSRHSSMSAGDR